MKIKTLVLVMAAISVVSVAAHANMKSDVEVGKKTNKVESIQDQIDVRKSHIERGHIVVQPKGPESAKQILTVVEARTIPAIDAPTPPIIGTRIVPIDVFEAKVDVSAPVIDRAQMQYDQFYNHAYMHLRAVYNPAVYGQYALPADIATMKVGRVKTGVLSSFDMFSKKDKLSIYLFQHKPAMRLYGLYEQRLIAWHKGRAPAGVTVERAINREAQHPFLDTAITSNATTLEMVKYLDGRLSVKDSDIIRAWLIKHQEEAKTQTVIDIIANGIAQQKLDSLYLR